MRVAFVTQWWSGKDDGFIAGLVRSLCDSGADISVLAGRGGVEGDGNHAGRSLRLKDEWQGIPVTTYPYFRSHDTSVGRRLLTYGTFAATSTLAASDLRDFDVVLAYGSPATAVSSAMVAQRRYGVPYVMHVQDIWPDSIFATGFLTGGRVRTVAERAVGRFVAAAYHHAAGVVGISPGARELLITRGVAPRKAHAVYNWISDDQHIEPITVPPRDPTEPLHLMYAGNLGPAQSLDTVLLAMALLPAGTARLTLLGSGAATDSLHELTARLGLECVTFAGSVPPSEVPQWQSTAHLNLISLADEDLFRITIPSKLQSLSCHGAPILCIAPGEVAGIVEKSEMGLTAPPGDPRALADVIQKAAALTQSELQTMGTNGRRLYATQMSSSIGAHRLLQILHVASRRRRVVQT